MTDEERQVDYKIKKDIEELDKKEGITESLEKQKKKKDKPEKTKETSKFIKNGRLWEQIYDIETNTSQFITYDEKRNGPVFIPYDTLNGEKLIPINDDLLQKHAIVLPSGIIEYGTDDDLEKEIKEFISFWLDISEEHLQHATWYIMLSWVIDKLNTIPYLRALGDYGTGKTRYLDVIGGICYKPMFVGGAVRSAPIFRTIDFWRGTTILDEFILEKSDESQDIIQILNNGFQRGKPVIRCDAINYEKVKAFDPFGAKILSTRTTFKDKALESRCFTEIMKVTARKKIPRDLTSNFFKKRNELQNKLLLYRFKNRDKINPDLIVDVDFGNILPRVQQTLSPFIVLFQYDEKKLKNYIEYAKRYNNAIIEENSSSFDGQVLHFYLLALERKKIEPDYEISASDIKSLMLANGWKEETAKTRVIGKHLKTLGFKIKVERQGDKTKRAIEIDGKELDSLIMRYVPEGERIVYEPEKHTEQTRFD